jgi:antirestriction protein
MTNSISNFEDTIDSRDVIERIEELRSEREDHGDNWAKENPDDAAELAALESLADEASGYAADWGYGEVLVRDSYFQDYAQELAEDCGAVDYDAAWPMNCIDWERAARDLRMDYTAVEFDGVTYWIR